jgi:hypothetical protein
MSNGATGPLAYGRDPQGVTPGIMSSVRGQDLLAMETIKMAHFMLSRFRDRFKELVEMEDMIRHSVRVLDPKLDKAVTQQVSCCKAAIAFLEALEENQ